MMYGAIDLHLRYSEIRVVDADGRVVRERRVVTSRETLTAAFAGLGELRVLLETGTEVSGWRRRWRPRATRSSWRIPTTRRCMARCAGA